MTIGIGIACGEATVAWLRLIPHQGLPYAAHGLLAEFVGTAARTYDANGNTTATPRLARHWVYTYNDRNAWHPSSGMGRLWALVLSQAHGASEIKLRYFVPPARGGGR